MGELAGMSKKPRPLLGCSVPLPAWGLIALGLEGFCLARLFPDFPLALCCLAWEPCVIAAP